MHSRLLWTKILHIAGCKAIVTPVHSQLHCAVSCGKETFGVTVEHCPVLATVGFGKPHLPAGVKWPWLGGGAAISLLQLSSAVAAAKVDNVLAAAFIGFFLPIPLPPIHIPFFVCNTHCEAISVSRCNEWKTVFGDFRRQVQQCVLARPIY